MRQKVETERPSSMRAREDVNRLVLAVHELGRMRVQVQEIAKSVENHGISAHATTASCTPTPMPPLFAERQATSNQITPSKRTTKPAIITSVPRYNTDNRTR